MVHDLPSEYLRAHPPVASARARFCVPALASDGSSAANLVVVAPWNYPYLTAVNAVLPALIAGNAVVLKHSHQTPLCAERFREAFVNAGVPAGVFQYLHLSHADTVGLINDGRVASVCFAGSGLSGPAVIAAATSRFANSGLELGGKDPAYVLKSASDLSSDPHAERFVPISV